MNIITKKGQIQKSEGTSMVENFHVCTRRLGRKYIEAW